MLKTTTSQKLKLLGWPLTMFQVSNPSHIRSNAYDKINNSKIWDIDLLNLENHLKWVMEVWTRDLWQAILWYHVKTYTPKDYVIRKTITNVYYVIVSFKDGPETNEEIGNWEM